MKKILKFGIPVLLLCLLFDFTGCQLAQPEKRGGSGLLEGDPFIGFHIVPEKIGETIVEEDGSMLQQIGDNDRSHWVEYGTEELQVDGFGSLEFPREILIGTYNEETRRYDFPGKEGFNCFLSIYTDGEGTNYINGYTDMTDTHLERKYTDVGEENILTAALYMETVVEGEFEDYDYLLTAYRVYQMEDGTVYLDGTGNSYAGGGFTIWEESKYTTTINGETTERINRIEFSIKDMMGLERVEVTWFGENSEILRRETVDLAALEGELTLMPPAGTVWATVEETDGEGNTRRTAMEPGYDGWAAHEIIVPDSQGIGQLTYLRWKEP